MFSCSIYLMRNKTEYLSLVTFLNSLWTLSCLGNSNHSWSLLNFNCNNPLQISIREAFTLKNQPQLMENTNLIIIQKQYATTSLKRRNNNLLRLSQTDFDWLKITTRSTDPTPICLKPFGFFGVHWILTIRCLIYKSLIDVRCFL